MSLRLRWLRWRDRMRCPSCLRKGFCEWHQELPGVKRGGRWCPKCRYGVHPPGCDCGCEPHGAVA